MFRAVLYETLKNTIKLSTGITIGFLTPSLLFLIPTMSKSTIDTMEKLNTPNKVCEYLSDFKYETDRLTEPMIKPAYLLIKDKKGDCKDFSNFAYEVANYHGIPVQYYHIYTKQDVGHAICIWKLNDGYYPICNVTCIGKKRIKKYSSIKEIEDFYLKVFGWKTIDNSYFAIPFPCFWKQLSNVRF